MKILQVNTLLKGGAAKACLRLHQGLLDMGTDSLLLTCEEEVSALPEVESFYSIHQTKRAKRLQRVKKKIHNVRNRVIRAVIPQGYENFNFPDSVYDITEHPAYLNADIIHFHWVNNFLDYCSFFEKNKKPIVWTMHDMTPFTGGYGYVKGFPMKRYKMVIEENAALKKKAYSGQNMHFVSPSDWLHQLAKQSEITENQSHYHISNGLDTTIYQIGDQQAARKQFNLPEDQFIMLFASDSLANKRKGIQHLLAAFDLLRNDKVTIAVAGNYLDDLIGDPRFIHLGNLTEETAMAAAYQAADVFAIPSIEDNFPNTVLEALCCGIPVVGFPVGGIQEQIVDGENGLLCKDVSSKSLMVTLREFLTKKASFDKEKISANARSTYNLPLQAKRYMEIYQHILGR